jgi:polar amino acid transport system substrate-binding protein
MQQKHMPKLNLPAMSKRVVQVGFLLLLSWFWLSSWSNMAEAAELRQIKQRGALIVGVKDNLPPLGWRDSQYQLQGFEIDLAHQLAVDLLGAKAKVEFKPYLNQERIPAVLNGEVDLLIARMTITNARMRLVDFSLPYYIDGTSFITRDAAIQTLRDLRQQTIAVLNGSDTIAAVRYLLPLTPLRGVASYAEAKTLLDSGELNVFAADAAVLTGWVQTDSRYRVLPNLISAEPLAIVIPKGLPQASLRQAVNRSIQQWSETDWLRQQVTAWGLPIEGLPNLEELSSITAPVYLK